MKRPVVNPLDRNATKEAQEMADFLDVYKIDFQNTISQISQEEVKTTTLRIENRKGKG